jgi:hypothetical protein
LPSSTFAVDDSLPCPSAPLQSITAAVSRRTPVTFSFTAVAEARTLRERSVCRDSRRRFFTFSHRGSSAIGSNSYVRAAVKPLDTLELLRPSCLAAAGAVGIRRRLTPRYDLTVKSFVSFVSFSGFAVALPSRDTVTARSPTTSPVGFGAFRRAQRGDRIMPVCLAGNFRSQGFSPSQRLHPTIASWLCFKPLPSIGFWPSELLPLCQHRYLSTPLALMPLNHALPLSQVRSSCEPSRSSKISGTSRCTLTS